MRAAEQALAGRREATLLSLPSVRRMAELLPRLISNGMFSQSELLGIRAAVDEALKLRTLLETP